jgi:hypothetical protein
VLVVGVVGTFLLGRAKTKQGKDAGRLHTFGMRPTEDAAMRRFAAGGADNRSCDLDHYVRIAAASTGR